jgi:D-alanine-D-alanine ligase-like ATP-grasp enzyme
MQSDTKKRVGILRGGAGVDYASSIKKGGDIISHIHENLGNKYKTFDILIDKNHIWHFNGTPIVPSDLVTKIDIAWNATHHSISNILDSLSIPHISTGSFSSSLANNRNLMREHVRKIGLDMPRAIVLPVYQKDFDGPREKYAMKKARDIFEKFSSPWIVKSYTPDDNMGIHMAKTFPELIYAIEDGVNHEKSILVEEFIPGKIATVHTVPHFRNEEMYTFPLVNTFGVFETEERERLLTLAKDLHRHLGATHYLKSDFVLNPHGKIYLLQIDGVPDLRSDSHFSQACDSVGTKIEDVVEHMLAEAFN